MTSQQDLERVLSREPSPVVVGRPQPWTAPRRLVPPGLVLRVLTVLGLVLTPIAAGLTAVSWAPPAQVRDIGLDGLSAQVDVGIGSNTIAIDSGLLGGLRRPGPVVLGKHVGMTVRPSNLNLSLFGPTGALDRSTIDVAGHLFADEQARRDELNEVTAAVLRHYGAIGFGTAYLVAMLEILGYAYLKHRRRMVARLAPQQRAAVLADRRPERTVARPVAVVAMLAVLIPAGYLCSPLSDRHQPISPDSQLQDTFLSGWQITGPFKYLITQAATTVDSLSKTEQAFYDRVSANRDIAFEARFGIPTLPRDPNLIRIAVLDDLQGTSGMARVVGESAQHISADAILNLGDLTATGTAQEAYLSYLKSYTVDVLARYAGDIPVYTSLGRHDTPAVKAYAKKVKFSVADGTAQKIAGAEFLGANSPYVSHFGSAAELIDPAITTETVAAGLRRIACADPPLAVYAHDKELLDEVTDSGCVPIVIGGHDYTGRPSADVSTPNGVVRRIILGSTGGHGAGDGFGGLSTPRNNAPFVLLTIDRTSGAVTADTVTVHPDASVIMTTSNLAPLSVEQLALLD
ncbi:MAG TPA: hypothetical protein VF557_15970 [Jatrophihabitans sp.]|jgi:hypothetical protein|uniref:metallophosphoesterase family protein n=1 Tax=Jatrophihabitans sp. TaxID=1932789 RepID=UPI002F09B71E